MKCEDVRLKITEYFSGLLSDEHHAQIRDHFSECLSCQDYAFSFSNLQNDLKRLGRRKPNFDIARSLSDALTKSQQVPIAIWRKPLFWIITLSVFTLGAVIFYGKTHPPKNTGKLSESKKPLEFVMLEKTLASLEKSPVRRVEARNYASEKSAFRALIQISPVHLDCQLSSLTQQDELQDLLSQTGKTIYQSSQIRILSVKVSELGAFAKKLEPFELALDALNRLVALSEGPLDTRTAILSFVFLPPTGSEQNLNFQHVHLQFARQNRSRYQEKLKEKYAMEYSADDLWVLQISGQAWMDLMKELGLASDIRIKDWALAPPQPEEEILAVIYAEDGWK